MNKMATIILKTQNVIYTYIFILVGTLSNNSFAQTKVNGTFCIDYALKDFSVCLIFETEKNFKYKHIGDTGMSEYGQGKYKIIGNKLILNYNKTEPIKIGHHLSKIWTNNKDSINVRFNFFDFDNVTLPYVNVAYKDSLSRHGYSGVSANEKGKAEINFKRDSNNLQFKISNLGFKQYEFTIAKNYNYDISILLQNEGRGLPILNQIDTLEIVKNKPRYFTVKNKNGSITTWRKRDD